MNPTVQAAAIAAGVGGLGIISTWITAFVSGRNSQRANNATIDATKANTKVQLDAARDAWLRDRQSELYADILAHISWRLAEVKRRSTT
jgi:hypothetical protein